MRFRNIALVFVAVTRMTVAAQAADADKAADKVAALAERFDNLRVESGSATVSGLTIRQGSGEFVLSSGSAVPVLAGSDRVGFFFKGKGSYTYRATDADELAVLTTNVKRASGLKLEAGEKSATVTDTFSQALVLMAGVPVPELVTAPAGESLAAAFEDHRKTFDRDISTPAVHQLIQQRLDASGRKFVRVEVTGGKEQAVYLHDEPDRGMESLYTLEKAGGIDRSTRNLLVPVIISDRPIGRSRRTPPTPRFTLSAIDYTLTADDRNASLVVTETITGVRDGLSVLRLDLYDIRYTEDGQRRYNVRKVTDEKGEELSFDHRDGQLLVGLGQPLSAGQAVKVRFEIDGDFLIRPNGDNFWQLGVEPWFPQPDLGEQYYTVHSLVKVKKPYVPFTPGKTIRRGQEGEYNLVESEIDKPVQFAVIHAGKYSHEEETRNGITIRVASYAGKNTKAMKQLTNLAFGIIESFQPFLGPFPFPELNIIEINTWGYGQAPPGTMFITKEAFNPLAGEINQLFSQGVNERFAHEIAHQYWGHVVKMPSEEEQWLTESFAEYSAAIFLRKFKGEGTFNSMVRHWKTNASEASQFSSIATANRIRIPGDGLQQIRSRTALIYDKGSYLLADLHKQLGDQVFLSFLKSYQKSFRWKFGSTNDVGGLLTFITKKDFTQYLDDYYWGTKMPK